MEKKYDLHDMPPKNGAFAKQVRINISFFITMGIGGISLLIIWPIHNILTEGVFTFSPWWLITSLGCIGAACWGLFTGDCRDYIAKSYERKVGAVTNVNVIRGRGGRENYSIQLSNESVNYAIPSRGPLQGPFMEGFREPRDGPFIKGAFFETDSIVEIFYGRRSKTLVWANVLVESNLEDRLAGEIVEAIKGMTEEEIEAAFLKGNKEKRQ